MPSLSHVPALLRDRRAQKYPLLAKAAAACAEGDGLPLPADDSKRLARSRAAPGPGMLRLE